MADARASAGKSSFLTGGGEMGAVMRRHDWPASPLGPPEGWPQSLRTTIELMLASRQGMMLAWGPELTQFYNDAYASFLGLKHPAALGRPLREVWSDVWTEIEPLVGQALAGEGVWFEDFHLATERNGFAEDTWWQFSYSPARDDDGVIRGLLDVASEMTAKVLAERRQAFRLALDERIRDLSDPDAVMTETVTMLGQHIGANRVGYGQVLPDHATVRLSNCFVRGVEPLQGDFPIDGFGADSIARQRRGETEICPDVLCDPKQDRAVWAAIDTRAFVSVPLVRDGRFRASLYVNCREPHRWSAEEVALIEDVATRTWATVERARAEVERGRAERLRTAQTRILEHAAQDMPLGQALDALVRTVEDLSESGVLASVLLLDEDGVHLRHGAGQSLPAAYNDAIDGMTTGPSAGSCGTAVHRKQPVYVCDIASDPLWADFRELARAHRLGSCWSTPIMSAGGAVLGTFAMYHREPREPATADLELVDFVVRSAALLIERKSAEARLRESEARTSFALEAGRMGAWELNLVTSALTTSQTSRTNFGRAAEAPFTYEQLRAAVHPDDQRRMIDAVDRSIATGEDYDIEYRVITPAGMVRWLEVRAKCTYDPDGVPLRMAGVSLDVTERREGEAALRSVTSSETRLRFLSELDDVLRASRDAPAAMLGAAGLLVHRLDASRCAYADVDPDNDCFVIRGDFTAPGVASSTGVYRLDLFGPRAAADMRQGCTLVVHDVAGELPSDSEREMFHAIGVAAIICCPLVKEGRLAAMMAVHQNRPRHWREDEVALVEAVVERCWAHVERVAAEARLRDSEARYRTLFEAIDVGFALVELAFDAKGRATDYRFAEINPAFERQTGLYGAAGKWVSETIPGLERIWFDTYGRVALTGEPVRFESYAAPIERWFDVHALRAGAPQQHRVAILFNDVTARKAAETELRELNETLERQVAARTVELRRFRDIVDATISPICAFDTEFRLTAFNKAHNDEFRRVNGFDSKLGDVFPDLFIPKQRPLMRALMARALTGERFTVVEVFGRPEFGQPSWEINYTPLFDEQGRIIGAFHLALDISDRLRAEADLALAQEALRQSQKMEAMGSLTGGVAHDFNNLLTPIVGSLDLLQRRGVGGEREQRMIAGAIQAAERAKVLVQRLLAFARRQPLQPLAVDLGALVSGMAELVASTTGPQIRVAVEVAAGLPAAIADPNQLEMALLNLAVNARDAMPDGGTLRITAAAETVVPPHRSGLKPGHYVRLSVADTGAGMDEATLRRAVEPFFSTKGVGKGTGLGLSMVHGLAQQLGGALTIQSRRGLGTNVELWLPESAAPAEAAGAVADAAQRLAPASTALLVDDEDVVRMSTAEMLGELGYAVTEASSAEEALALLRDGFQPKLIVTDHLMPGMNGTDLARTIRADHPEIQVLLVSGYAESEGVAPDVPRLTKPFRNDELAASLASLSRTATNPSS